MEGFPRRFGGYVLVKPLARGGMGALYLAVHGQRGMEKLCVVKTALPHLIEKGYLQRFKDEAKVVVRLSHGNLVGVFDAGQVKGEIFLGMEFVEGKDLRAVWNRCAQKGIAFPLPVAVHIAKELARGLGYAHTFEGLKLVHRDVSPPNVLLSYSGEVKLTDFGLATSTLKLEKTAPGVVYGKVSYMAPEQARGEALDGRTDLYAAGIILWELLTGRQLFATATRVPGDDPQDDLLERVRHPQIVPPSQKASRVPRELDIILMKALAAKPEDRFQSGEEFRTELAAFLAKNAPAMDGHQVARFLRDLFSDTMVKERAEREEMTRNAVALLEGVSGTQTPAISPPAGDGKPAGHEDHVDTAPLGLRDKPATPETPKPLEEGSRMVGALLAGRYQIKRLCGEGGMGRVYEAEHIEIGKRVAIKVLHPAYSRTPDLVERFRREARAASRIEHPNVVNVTDFGTTDDGSLFFVMEYIEGIELGLLIHREGPLAPVRALRIAEQMCEALQAAHDAGVIHRDLKPENILLLGLGNSPRTPPSGQSSPGMEPREPSDFVKVLDFGIAKSAEIEENSRKGRRLTRPGVAMGTPEYMAPEQAAGHPADPRSDIYAVGSIMYEMLCGTPPYEGDNVMEVLHKKANEPPAALAELRPALTPAIVALVERAMARAPDDRPKSMADLAYEIHTVETSLVMTPPPVLQRPASSTSSRDDAQGGYQAIFGEVSETRVVRHFPRRQRYYVLAGLATVLLAIFPVVRLVHSLRVPSAPAAAPVVPLVPPPPPPSASSAWPVVLDSGPQLDSQASSPPMAPSSPEPTAEQEAVAEEPNEGGRREPGAHGARGPGMNAKQNGDLLREAQQFLHAQRYEEARVAFAKLLAGRQYRGAASAGLAKIAFQEKDYKEAVERARDSARMGGGAEARVLLGDAYFKLEKFDEAKKAYSEALKLDPNNRVAGQGLRLVEGR
jgi:serine/threonine protein kinase